MFIGGGAVVMDNVTGGGLGLVGVALAHALVLSVMVTATMTISGGHLNPAVTIALYLAKKIDVKLGSLYIVTQLLAAAVAALALKGLLPATAGEVTAYGAPSVSGSISVLQAIGIEALLTFFLVCAVFGTAVSPGAPKVGGFGIGLVLLFDILMGGPLTGAAMNPARAFGPALVGQQWQAHYVYWIGPILGGLAAALLWGGLLLPRGEEA